MIDLLSSEVQAMLSFIIFSSDIENQKLYIKILKKFLYVSYDFYKIYEYSEFNCFTWREVKKIDGKRIFLLSDDIYGISGFELARKIRKDGDFNSSIILITKPNQKYSLRNIKNTLILNVIEQNEKFIPELLESLQTSYCIATKNAALTFSVFDEVYRIPYEDIYFIEKNTNDDTVTIYTREDSYLYYISIKRLSEKLNHDSRFMLTHRSCIVNLYKIVCYNSKENQILFDNNMTTKLVCRMRKKSLTERLKKDSNLISN